MIRSFADKRTETLFEVGEAKKVPPDIVERAIRKLDMIDAAISPDDLKVPPGNRLHALKGDRAGQYSVSVNDQWCLCFRFEDEHAYDVELCDYH